MNEEMIRRETPEQVEAELNAMGEQRIAGVPDELGRALWLRRVGKYTRIVAVFNAVALWDGAIVGAVGDGGNASYEWFVWREGQLLTSDAGYGSPDVALRDVLVREVK